MARYEQLLEHNFYGQKTPEFLLHLKEFTFPELKGLLGKRKFQRIKNINEKFEKRSDLESEFESFENVGLSLGNFLEEEEVFFSIKNKEKFFKQIWNYNPEPYSGIAPLLYTTFLERDVPYAYKCLNYLTIVLTIRGFIRFSNKFFCVFETLSNDFYFPIIYENGLVRKTKKLEYIQ
jgi:hypothetical protein